MNNWLNSKYLFKITFSLAILTFLALRVDFEELLFAFLQINFPFYLLSILIAVCGSVIIASKYYILSVGTKVETKFLRIVAINFIARFYGILVPSGIGQGAVRWYKMTRERGGRAYFFAATVFERLLFVATSLFFALVPLYIMEQNKKVLLFRNQLQIVFILLFILISIGFLILLWPRLHKILVHLLTKVPFFQRPEIQEGLQRFTLKELNSVSRWLLVLLSVVWQFIYVTRVYCLILAMGQPLLITQVVWVSSLVFLLQLLPISVAGLGVREGGYVYLLSLLGFSDSVGFLLGLLFFTHMLIFALIGGLLSLFDKL